MIFAFFRRRAEAKRTKRLHRLVRGSVQGFAVRCFPHVKETDIFAVELTVNLVLDKCGAEFTREEVQAYCEAHPEDLRVGNMFALGSSQ